MSNTRIPWFEPQVGQLEQDYLANVVSSGYINDGDVTRRLEARIAELAGVKHCVAVTSGTAAISLALMAFGIGVGDEVIVPDLTFIATANAVRMTGADVRLVDCESRRFTIDVDAVERAIGPRTRAIVPVDVNGRGADYGRLEALCRNRGLYLVCDAAEALGSKYMGSPLGSFGHASCFSFSANKTVTSGQGGMIATNDPGIRDRLLELKDQGRRKQGTGGNDAHPVLGFNFKLTNLQAAVALAQLERLSERLAAFRVRDRLYAERLSQVPGVELPSFSHDGEVRQWTDVLIDDRDTVETALAENGIGCRPFWYPLHSQPPYSKPSNDFTVAIDVSRRGLWLPSHFRLTESEIDRTCDVIRKLAGLGR